MLQPNLFADWEMYAGFINCQGCNVARSINLPSDHLYNYETSVIHLVSRDTLQPQLKQYFCWLLAF